MYVYKCIECILAYCTMFWHVFLWNVFEVRKCTLHYATGMYVKNRTLLRVQFVVNNNTLQSCCAHVCVCVCKVIAVYLHGMGGLYQELQGVTYIHTPLTIHQYTKTTSVHALSADSIIELL